MRFCDTCDSKLLTTPSGDKCPKCDKESLEQSNQKSKQDISIPHYSLGQDFPFEKINIVHKKKLEYLLDVT